MYVNYSFVIEKYRLDEDLDLPASRDAFVQCGYVNHRRILKKHFKKDSTWETSIFQYKSIVKLTSIRCDSIALWSLTALWAE